MFFYIYMLPRSHFVIKIFLIGVEMVSSYLKSPSKSHRHHAKVLGSATQPEVELHRSLTEQNFFVSSQWLRIMMSIIILQLTKMVLDMSNGAKIFCRRQL